MAFISFGKYIDNVNYKVIDERAMRAAAGIKLLLGFIAFVNGFILQKYIVLPYISGFLLLNFAIGIFINPKFAPTFVLGRLAVWKQTPIYIGAVQKKFAWSLGLLLSIGIFWLSLLLLNNPALFEPVCFLCLICITLLFIETAFGICVGCKLYNLTIFLKIIPKPKERPNCMGNSCEVK